MVRVYFSRGFCFPRSVGRAKDKTIGRDRKKNNERKREIYVPSIFFRATTLTAYKMFAKRVWVSRESTDHVDSTTSNKDVSLDARDDVNVRKDALVAMMKSQGNVNSKEMYILTRYP